MGPLFIGPSVNVAYVCNMGLCCQHSVQPFVDSYIRMTNMATMELQGAAKKSNPLSYFANF